MNVQSIPLIIGGASTLAMAVTSFCAGCGGIRPVSPGEERAAAESVLAAKLSGPGYFNVTPAIHQEGGGRWIEVDDALSQVPRIVATRNLGPARGPQLEALVEACAEPHPYRMVGGKRIDLPRLNLSLDALAK